MRTHARNPAPKKIRSPAAEALARARLKGQTSQKLENVFASLRDLMAKHAANLDVKHDLPGNFQLNALRPDGRHERAFGAVNTGPAFVSYHLFPVYMFPELTDSISPTLLGRMQGKSCFNFAQYEPELFAELDSLTRRAFEEMKRRDLL
jgi:hypothetical protein